MPDVTAALPLIMFVIECENDGVIPPGAATFNTRRAGKRQRNIKRAGRAVDLSRNGTGEKQMIDARESMRPNP